MDKLLATLGIKPNNKQLFIEAFTHPSFSNENKNAVSYQRLEFLGDAILGKIVVEKIYLENKNKDEGEMTLLKSESIKGATLAKFSLELNFDEYIRFGKNSDYLKTSLKILEDIFESFVGALYLDQGEKKVKVFLESNVFTFINKISEQELRNPKTLLQEYLQSESRGNIIYESEKTKDDFFLVKVFHDKNHFGQGKGKTKKEAEVNAAKDALKLLGEK